jgi:hypothetical protein
MDRAMLFEMGTHHVHEALRDAADLAHCERSAVRHRGEMAHERIDVRSARVLAEKEVLLHALVGVEVEQRCARGESVAAGAADLLVVALDGVGQLVVDDEARVGLVDAHAERFGGDDDPVAAVHEASWVASRTGGGSWPW